MDVPEHAVHNKVERIRVSKIFSSNATNIFGMENRNNTNIFKHKSKTVSQQEQAGL